MSLSLVKVLQNLLKAYIHSQLGDDYVNIGIIQRRFMKFKVGDFSLGKQPSCILCVKMTRQF